MRSSTLAAALLLVTSTTVSAALQPGDIAFTAFNADEDGFALVALRPLAPFSTIYFSDNEWGGGVPGSGTFNTGENTYAWVSGPETLAAGTAVRFSAIDQATRAASIGAFGLFQGGTPGFSATGDTLYAYAGDASAIPTQFLAALSSEAFAGSTLTDSGLIPGINAVAIGTGADFAEYSGPRTGAADFTVYAGLLHDPSQWTSFATGDFALRAPDLTPFAVAAVPEPSAYALLATGLGLVGWRLRKRAREHAPWTLCACERRSGLTLA
jgi:hypothetical protein